MQIDDPAVRWIWEDNPYPGLIHSERKCACERRKELDMQLFRKAGQRREELRRPVEREPEERRPKSSAYAIRPPTCVEIREELNKQLRERWKNFKKSLTSSLRETEERETRLDAFHAGAPIS